MVSVVACGLWVMVLVYVLWLAGVARGLCFWFMVMVCGFSVWFACMLGSVLVLELVYLFGFSVGA